MSTSSISSDPISGQPRSHHSAIASPRGVSHRRHHQRQWRRVPVLDRPGRAVIAATKSGTEKNATVFARYWVEALQDPSADIDKSDSISAMEAFNYATKKTAAFYDSQKRLATEHAVFNDAGAGEPVREAGDGQGAFFELHFVAARFEPASRQ